MSGRVEIPSSVVNLTVFGNSDARKVRNVVVKRVIVLVMNNSPLWYSAVMVFPNGNVQCDLVPVAWFSAPPEITSSVLLLGVTVPVVLAAIEYDRFRV